MKKLLLVVLGVFMFAGASYAQDFKPFKIGLGLGYAIPGGEGAGGGILIYGEPMYRINDAIAVGLRLETALVAKAQINNDGTWGETSLAGIGSYTLSGQYYFSNGGFRPLVGAGFGLYSVSTAAFNENSTSIDAGWEKQNKFGFYPRVGFDAGHFNFMLEYNLIPASEIAATDMNGNATTMDVKNSYFSIKVGASILGGRR